MNILVGYLLVALLLVIFIFIIFLKNYKGGLGINIAHELIHKQNLFEKTLGKILLISVFYGHFYIEHLYGHHKKVININIKVKYL